MSSINYQLSAGESQADIERKYWYDLLKITKVVPFPDLDSPCLLMPQSIFDELTKRGYIRAPKGANHGDER